MTDENIYSGQKLWDDKEPAKIVTKIPNLIHSGSILDLAAGKGRNAFYLANLGFDVTAVEIDPERIAILQQTNTSRSNKIAIIESDINSFNPKKQFDVIICIMALHFLSPENVVSIIQKMKKWTKISGYNAITAFSDKNKPETRPYLFKHNELSDYYRDWEVISYKEGPTSWFVKPEGTPPQRNQGIYLLTKQIEK